MRKNNNATRSVKRCKITTVDGKIKADVYAVGGEEGVFAVSCDADSDQCVSLYSGDDGSWRYMGRYHRDWIKSIVYCISLSR